MSHGIVDLLWRMCCTTSEWEGEEKANPAVTNRFELHFDLCRIGSSVVRCNKLITLFFSFFIFHILFIYTLSTAGSHLISLHIPFHVISRLIKIKYKIICLNCQYQHFLQKIKIPNHLQSFSHYLCIFIVVVVVVVFSRVFS